MTHPLLITGARPFAELMANRDQLAKAVESMTVTIRASFAPGHVGAMRQITRAEIRRRFALCEKAYRRLRADLGWGHDRALAELPAVLTCELSGQPYEPPKRSMYVAGHGERGRQRGIIAPSGR